MFRRGLGLSVVLLLVVCSPSSVSPVTVAPSAPGGISALVDSVAPADDLMSTNFCDGVQVSAVVVVTAWHCVAGRTPDSFDVILQPGNLCYPDVSFGARAKPIEIRRISSRPDLAAITIANTPGNRGVPLIPLASVDLADTTETFAVGFGETSPGQAASCTVRTVALRPVSAALCSDAGITDTEFCATPPTGADTNTCPGFSGGPVYQRHNGALRLVGIVSRGKGCTPKDPGVYETIPQDAASP